MLLLKSIKQFCSSLTVTMENEEGEKVVCDGSFENGLLFIVCLFIPLFY